MSGFEVTGLVLAALPLLANKIDNYVQGLETLKSFRTRKYRRELQRYLDRIRTQRALFLNTLEQTLEDAVDDEDTILDLISHPSGHLWNAGTIQSSMRRAVGRDYDVFHSNMTELSLLLNTLCMSLNLHPESPIEVSWNSVSVAEREARKLKTILSKSL
ncbi:hypothetical protein BJY04DRAFT_222564 [Aspergillus karnatakaensis]|uniref:uncharacterized protein n=1 Tax=Aspergillus karnatakaensis TaxID=1810916 RepID=UPI003CCE1F01